MNGHLPVFSRTIAILKKGSRMTTSIRDALEIFAILAGAVEKTGCIGHDYVEIAEQARDLGLITMKDVGDNGSSDGVGTIATSEKPETGSTLYQIRPTKQGRKVFADLKRRLDGMEGLEEMTTTR